MLELVVCSAILLTCTLAAARAQLDSNRLLTQAQQTNVAVGIAQSALERVLEEDLDELLAGEAAVAIDGEVPTAEALLANQQLVLDTPGYEPGVDPLPDRLEVRVTLNWTSLTGHPRSLAMAGVLR